MHDKSSGRKGTQPNNILALVWLILEFPWDMKKALGLLSDPHREHLAREGGREGRIYLVLSNR